jgi:Cu(I)/Ag(I) efflux system protein CusF
MKKLVCITMAFGAAFAFSQSALADDMAGMKMNGTMMMSPAASSKTALTDAEIKKVDTASGMVTLKHGALQNVGMPAMTMAFKAKDAAMLKQAHEGDKVKVRVENVAGTMTIVTMQKQ